MHKYKVVFAPTAEKQFLDLTKLVRIRIAQAILKLSITPFLGKQLRGELKEYRSYRVGDWRIVYFLRHQVIQIEIIRIAHRKEVYRD